MSVSLTRKYVLVTGATDGLGKVTALTLAKEGANVFLHGRNRERVEKIVNELTMQYPSQFFQSIVCDLEKSEDLEKAFSKIEKLDILINNAGTWIQGNTIDTSLEKISELTKVNMLAPLLITRILLPVLLQSEFGQICNIVSKDGAEIPYGYFDSVYVATKYAMQGFTESLSKEFYNKNLRVMGYYPGGMETNIFKKAGDSVKQHEPWMFDPQESADAILFMLTRNKKVAIKRIVLVNQLEG